MSIVDKYGYALAAIYTKTGGGLIEGQYSCSVPENKKETTLTFHYVAVAGLSIEDDNYYVLIHDSWGLNTFKYYRILITDQYVYCNLLNFLFVLETK